MNKTIYLPDEEAETWEKARRLANDRLSPVLLKALKEYVAAKEAEAAGFERIQVEFEDSDDYGLPKRGSAQESDRTRAGVSFAEGSISIDWAVESKRLDQNPRLAGLHGLPR
jgi:hypothetical protein